MLYYWKWNFISRKKNKKKLPHPTCGNFNGRFLSTNFFAKNKKQNKNRCYQAKYGSDGADHHCASHCASHSTSFRWTVFLCELQFLSLMIGLGPKLDYISGSKLLINELFRLGQSVSYDEVTRFIQNSILSHNFENIIPKNPDSATQWVPDNVDHNVCTLDGKKARYGIYGHSSSNDTVLNLPVQRHKTIKFGTAIAKKCISMRWQQETLKQGLSMFTLFIRLQFPYVLPVLTGYDLVCHSVCKFSTENQPRSNWVVLFKMYQLVTLQGFPLQT